MPTLDWLDREPAMRRADDVIRPGMLRSVRKEVTKWAKVVKDSGATPD